MESSEFPKIIVHRGHLIDLPENAAGSIKKVLKLTPDYIEINIAVTKDNKIILLHDPDLERTTNGRGQIMLIQLKENVS